MTAPALEVRSLCKRFDIRGRPAIQALSDVSLTLARHEAMGIIGESGSGKSTLARIVVGLESATSGEVLISSSRVRTGGSRRERHKRARTIQMVFQDPYSSLDPLQTIGGMLRELLHHHFGIRGVEANVRVEQLLSDVGLDPALASKRPGGLSGGERQRAAIARALAPEPDILLLDEAVSALDVSVQAQVLNLTNRIRTERQLAVLFITHDLAVVRQICDTVCVMQHGRIIERGDTARVLDRPLHDYTRMLREAVPGPGWNPHVLEYKETGVVDAAG